MFLVFMQNATTQADFALPVQAPTRQLAAAAARASYPAPQYALLTTYSLPELQRVVADATRWPGVPSNVAAAKAPAQAGPGQRLTNLPPLPSLRPVAAAAPVAPVMNPPNLLEALKHAAPTGATVQRTAPAPPVAPAGAFTLQQAMAALRGQAAPASTLTTTRPAAAAPQAAALPTTRSLSAIEILRGMRG
jgi:hypothetical protein